MCREASHWMCAVTTLPAPLCLPAFLLLHHSPTLTLSTLLPRSHTQPFPAPLFLRLNAGANFRASSLDPSIQLEASLQPCLAQEHLSWMCSTERSNPPLGHIKGVLEGREGGALGKVEGGSRLAQSSMLFNHAKVPW